MRVRPIRLFELSSFQYLPQSLVVRKLYQTSYGHNLGRSTSHSIDMFSFMKAFVVKKAFLKDVGKIIVRSFVKATPEILPLYPTFG